MTALQDITVLDLTRVLSGPYCTMLLGDLGARVIKIEQPGRGDDTRGWGPPFTQGESAYFLSANRNKQSVTIDLKSPEGIAIVRELIGRADVVVENFRPGTVEKLGLDYGSLAALHRRLIYCSISGFGQTGPRREEPGYDALMQAEAGLMSITGPRDGSPFRLGVAIVDLVAGMFAAQGILAALYAREKTGRGQSIDIGMLDAATALLTYQAESYFVSGDVPGRLGNRHPSIAPYETFAAADGDFMLAVGNDDQWRRFCDAAGLDLGERFGTNAARVTLYAEMKPVLERCLHAKSRAYWMETLGRAGVPCGAIRDLRELFADPQISAREMVTDVQHTSIGPLRVLGSPLKLSDTPAGVRTAPPRLGEHTETVLMADLGRSAEEVRQLRAKGTI